MFESLKMERPEYRTATKVRGLATYRVKVKESDLLISTPNRREKEALEALLEVRLGLEGYLELHQDMAPSLVPVKPDKSAPPIIKEMCQAAQVVGVGPMAAVAGAIAQFVGEKLLAIEREVIVENGGDIFIKSSRKRVVALYAGDSPLSMKIGIRVKPEEGLGICTSSGRFGHSLSLGKAHSVTVVAARASLSDALATHLGNIVKGPQDIKRSILKGSSYPGVKGIVIICEDRLGAWGDLELVNLKDGVNRTSG